MRSIVAFGLCAAGYSSVAAFSPAAKSQAVCFNNNNVALSLSNNDEHVDGKIMETSRREMIGRVAGAAFGLSTTDVLFAPTSAQASGGATAGGAYLLSAKQRYNSRVTAGIKSFLALSASLESGSIDEAKKFLSSDEEGGWGDLKSAGYLLSNAFRTSSTKPPDSLPSVRAWKAFQAEVDKMQKAADKKSKSGVADAYKKAVAALDDYLELVELPPAIEMGK